MDTDVDMDMDTDMDTDTDMDMNTDVDVDVDVDMNMNMDMAGTVHALDEAAKPMPKGGDEPLCGWLHETQPRPTKLGNRSLGDGPAPHHHPEVSGSVS